MIRSYVLVSIRNLLKRKGYSAINVVGLSMGLAAVILIFLYGRHELTYDRFHENGDRIYLVYKERLTPTGTQVTRDTWMPMADRLLQEYPSVEGAVRMWGQNGWVRYQDQRFQEIVTYADPSLFEVFSFPLRAGDPASLASDPKYAVISKDVAARYFGDEDPIGRVLRIDNAVDYTVRGVLDDVPSNSTIDIDIVVPVTSVPGYADAADDWGGSFLFTYVLLDDAASAPHLQARFPALIRNIWEEEVALRTHFKLEPLHDLQDALTGNRQYAYILLGIALVILLIASINFMNLATARSLERAREIGMRKVLGAQRQQVVVQFISESTILALISLGLGFLLVYGALPFFNDLYAIDLGVDFAEMPYLPAGLVLLGIGVGVLAGAYPAFYISRFKPVRTLRGALKSTRGGITLRHGLVVTQFALAIGLIALTLVMHHQLSFLQDAELRFDGENVVVIPVQAADFDDSDAAVTRLRTFEEELRRSPDILSVSAASHAPGRWSGWFTFARPEGWGEQDPLRMRLTFVDAHYFDTYGIGLVEGRDFDADRVTDAEGSVVVNEAALESFGWEKGVGRTVRRGDTDFEIVGVVNDYHFASLREEIAPVLHFYRPPENTVHNFVAVRVRPGREQAALGAVSQAWTRLDPARDLPFEFADQTFAQLYQQEQRLISVAGTFTVLAVLIACLGLLGLASWSVTQRVKEVGIRKVLGASTGAVVMLLSKEFMRLVLIALVVAVPVAYAAAGRWLSDFAYRIDLDPLTFALAGGAALLIAFITVSTMALRAALTDPVNTLRYE